MQFNESWTIRTSTDDLLNFIIYTGCMYNLIDDKNFDEENKPWPTNLLNSNIDDANLDNLKLQWKLWFEDIIEEKCSDNNLDKMCRFVDEVYDTSDFSELKYIELRECCKRAYPYFIEWWTMQAGGKDGISYYEFIGNSKISDYVNELECKLDRKAKPFNLFIDMVYTGVPKVLDVNDEYIVVTPSGYFNLDRDWWMNKLTKLI